MVQSLDYLRETPSQTSGPYVHIGCIPSFAGVNGIYQEDLATCPIQDGASGTPITIQGKIFDGTGWAMRDALFESWQPDASGLFPGMPGADPNVSGFCRFAADKQTGQYQLNTVKPGSVKTRQGLEMAPHISIWIVARGINIGLHTRIYFPEDDHSTDPVLGRIEQRQRVQTLIATKTSDGVYEHDFHLQGDQETVFLDV